MKAAASEDRLVAVLFLEDSSTLLETFTKSTDIKQCSRSSIFLLKSLTFWVLLSCIEWKVSYCIIRIITCILMFSNINFDDAVWFCAVNSLNIPFVYNNFSLCTFVWPLLQVQHFIDLHHQINNKLVYCRLITIQHHHNASLTWSVDISVKHCL